MNPVPMHSADASRDHGPVCASNSTIFAFLFAFGLLMHKNQLAEWASLPVPFLTAATAVMLLFRPESPRLFLVFCASFLVETAWYAPFIVNHAWFFGVVTFGVCVAYASVYRRNGRLPQSLSEIEPDIFPLVRAGTILLFGFATLHKLNHAYLSPLESCAMSHYDSMREMFGFLPQPHGTASTMFVVYSSLMLEALIPTLLLFRRTRHLGMIVAFGFHYFIASHQARAFSSLSLCMYTTFLPTNFYVTVNETLRRIWQSKAGRLAIVSLPVGMFVMVALSVGFAWIQRYYQTALLGTVLYYVFALGIFAVYMAAQRRNRETLPTIGPVRLPWQWAVIALIIVNGFTPYLGLQTQNVFSMFSNLRTEEQQWNHVFLPRSLRVFGLQDTVIRVLEVEVAKPGRHFQHEFLLGFHRHYEASHLTPNTRVTEFEFRRSLGLYCGEQAGPVRIRYEKKGVLYDVSDACAVADLRSGNNPVLEKVLRFRHPIPEARRCPGTT